MSQQIVCPEGIVHAHSRYSYDGHCTYAELRDFFRSQGLHFACMTEHIEDLQQNDIDEILRACREHSDGDFIFVPGIEMDCFYVYFLGLKDVEVNFSNNHTVFTSLRSRAELCIFSHPIKAHYRYSQWLVDECDGVEVLNTKHDGQHYLRPQSERLYRAIKRVRPHAVAIAGMDFHSRKNYTAVRLKLLQQGPFNEQLILQALANERFVIVKDHESFSSYTPFRRNMSRTRIYVMDFAHAVHRRMHQVGIPISRKIKRFFRDLTEGRE